MAEAFPDEDWLQDFSGDGSSEPIEHQEWHKLYFRAWESLRYDRSYGALGGQGPIPYMVISQYARDHNITGNDFWIFERFLGSIDSEWLKFVSERSQGDG